MNFKKILFSSIFMVIGLHASEVDPKDDFLKILKSSSGDSKLSRNDLKGLNLLLTQHPEIAQDPDVLIMTINRNLEAAVVELLLQNGAVPDVGAMQTIMSQIYTYRGYDIYTKKRLKPVLKVLMQYGGKVDRDLKILTKHPILGSSNVRNVAYKNSSVFEVSELAQLINKIKAEIEEEKDETRALAAFMTEAGLRTRSGNRNTAVAVATNQMFGNSEESLGRSAELKK